MLGLLNAKPKQVELVLTGRNADPDVVKVIVDREGFALDFFRLPNDRNPGKRSHGHVLRHIGLYAYRRRFLLELAALEFFDNDPSKLDIKEGMISSVDGTGKRVSIAEVMTCMRPEALSPQGNITGRSALPMPPSSAFARHFAAHFADVEVDTDTGQIKLLDYVATQDSGTVVNPKILENQIIGGAILGAGFALSEVLVFDDHGKILNPNLTDYKLLRSVDFPVEPRMLFHESYEPVGPFGARSAGEAPIATATPAISQAVYNAIGVWVDVPMTPEKVLKALKKI